MKTTLLAFTLLALAACGGGPRVPDWKMTAQSAAERATDAYLTGKAPVEKVEFDKAREQVASTGQPALVIRIELLRCATRVAALVFEDCPGFDKLLPDATAADIAYANYLAGKASAAELAMLPEPQRAAATAANEEAAAKAVAAMPEPLSRLVAAGALLRAGRASPALLAQAVDTASAQGWRRPLLAWLGVQAQRAEQAGDSAEAARLRRRIALASGQ